MSRGSLLSSFLFIIVLDILTGIMEQEKEIKGKGQKKKEEAKLSLPADNKIMHRENPKSPAAAAAAKSPSRVQLCATP